MRQIVAVDIGGTNARFALARTGDGRVESLTDEIVLKCAEYASLQTAWEAFAAKLGRPLPRAAAIAVACPVSGEVLQMTNNPWIIRPGMIGEKLGLDEVTLINDFGAIGHAVAKLGPEHFRQVCGPTGPLPTSGVISILGPGTGLGVALLVRDQDGARILETERRVLILSLPLLGEVDRASCARRRGRPPRPRPIPFGGGKRGVASSQRFQAQPAKPRSRGLAERGRSPLQTRDCAASSRCFASWGVAGGKTPPGPRRSAAPSRSRSSGRANRLFARTARPEESAARPPDERVARRAIAARIAAGAARLLRSPRRPDSKTPSA